MNPDFIDMSGAIVGNMHVTDYAPTHARRAYWRVICAACKHEKMERGCNIRKAQKRTEWRLRCKGCGA